MQIKIIHSDGASTIHLGLGLLEKSGTIDFYPNGGRDQTNCAAVKDKIITGLINIVTLNIGRVKSKYSSFICVTKQNLMILLLHKYYIYNFIFKTN